MRTDGSLGLSRRAMTDFVAQFGANGTTSSLCDDSYAPALSQLGNAIGRSFTSHCLDATVADSNPTLPGIQASCDVVSRAPSFPDQALPQCDMASPSGGPQPCWYLTSNTTCTFGRAVRGQPQRRLARGRDDLDSLRQLPVSIA